MEKEFVTYEQALELKYLGFDLPCFAWFDNFDNNNLHTWRVPDTMVKPEFIKDSVIAPLYQQVFEWFRTKHNIIFEISSNSGKFAIFSNDAGYRYKFNSNEIKLYDNYNDTRNKCIEIAINKLNKNRYEKK